MTQEAAHTDGPDIWLQEDEAEGRADCGCLLVAEYTGEEGGDTPDPALFMCPLHNAAPTMLAVLERLMQSQRDSDAECVSGSADDYCLTHEYEAWPCPVDSARAAIAQARGEKVQG